MQRFLNVFSVLAFHEIYKFSLRVVQCTAFLHFFLLMSIIKKLEWFCRARFFGFNERWRGVGGEKVKKWNFCNEVDELKALRSKMNPKGFFGGF